YEKHNHQRNGYISLCLINHFLTVLFPRSVTVTSSFFLKEIPFLSQKNIEIVEFIRESIKRT
ncbi:hypothetical protein ABI953_22245, partial [Bacillus paralicheniformis]|uniref:hypothetical protein n=1 Tax=Bacillus paralicheniformis TaxID=1648923 RepID=UPI003D1ED45A